MFYPLFIRDIIEIFFLSTILYAFCIWLKTDKTKNILGYFVTYCTLSVACWTFELSILSLFLFSYAPVMIILFIILHEKTLQKNFITLYNPTYKTELDGNWLDHLLSCALTVINANKSITILIENKDSLTAFVNAPFFINATMHKDVLDLLLASSFFDEHKMVWIDSCGIIRSINTSWIDIGHSGSQDALFYTSQTDAIIFTISPLHRTFTLIMDGKETTALSAHHVRTLIKKQTTMTVQKRKNKGMHQYENRADQNIISF